MEKKIILGDNLPEKTKEEFKEYPELVSQLLFYRGVESKEEAEKFLNPNYEKDLFNPFLIKGMDLAVQRILKAVKQNEKILIFSDYDADGIPGAVILHDFFKKIDFNNFEVYIPNRLREGYGLKKEAIQSFVDKKIDLMITVDSGISDIEAVQEAKKIGMDVIVTDHHLVGDKLPPADIILNSKQDDDTYPDDMLCGAALIFKLVLALTKKGNFNFSKGWEKWLLDMVALATVADMVPLRKENRVLAHYGLLVLRKSPRIGLQKLLRKAWIKQNQLVEEDISFMIAPRINAASRVSDPRIAFDLLTTNDEIRAGQLADELEALNNKRKTLVATAVRKAKRKIKERGEKEVIVIGDPDWNVGLSGLIASSLQRDFEKTCFVWGTDDSGKYCGSCRSGKDNLIALMDLVEEGVFEYFGGHKMAGGFSVSQEKIHFLEEEVIKAFLKTDKKEKEKELFVDKKISLDEVHSENYKLLERMAPFGIGNLKPLFLFEDIEIFGERVFGKSENHLEIVFKNSKSQKIKAIQFFSEKIKDKKSLLKTSERVSFLANMEKDTFNGADDIRLKIVEILN